MRKKRKLVYIIHGLDAGIGGAELACLSALPSLHERFDLRVYVLGGRSSKLLDGIDEDIVHRMKFYRSGVYTMLFLLPFLYGSLRSFKPDIIISSLWRSSVVGWCYKYLHRSVTYFLLVHSSEYFHWADRIVTTRAMHICDAVFADSQATGQFAERIMGGKANISVLSYLLDAPPAVLPPRQFKSAKRFLFVGRLNEVKQVPLAVKVIAVLRAAGIDAELHIYGRDDGDRANVEQAIAHYGLRQHVVLKGEFDPRKKHAVFASYDYYIQLSAQEGMAMSVAEAMQYGAVCVVTPVGGIAQYAIDGYSAIFVDAADEAAWSDSMQRIIDVVEDVARCKEMSTAAFNTFRGAPVFADALIEAIDHHAE